MVLTSIQSKAVSLGYQTGSLWSRLQQNRMKHDSHQLVWPLDIAFLCMMVLCTLQLLGLDYISLHKFRYYAYLQFHLPDPQYQRNVHIHTYTQLKHTYTYYIYMIDIRTACWCGSWWSDVTLSCLTLLHCAFSFRVNHSFSTKEKWLISLHTFCRLMWITSMQKFYASHSVTRAHGSDFASFKLIKVLVIV